MLDNFNVNLRENEGFPTCIPCIPIPEHGQSNPPIVFKNEVFRFKNIHALLEAPWNVLHALIFVLTDRKGTIQANDESNE